MRILIFFPLLHKKFRTQRWLDSIHHRRCNFQLFLINIREDCNFSVLSGKFIFIVAAQISFSSSLVKLFFSSFNPTENPATLLVSLQKKNVKITEYLNHNNEHRILLLFFMPVVYIVSGPCNNSTSRFQLVIKNYFYFWLLSEVFPRRDKVFPA